MFTNILNENVDNWHSINWWTYLDFKPWVKLNLLCAILTLGPSMASLSLTKTGTYSMSAALACLWILATAAAPQDVTKSLEARARLIA